MYNLKQKIPKETSMIYRSLLTVKEIEYIAKSYGFDKHTLLNLLYRKTKINHRTLPMVESLHEAVVDISSETTRRLKSEHINTLLDAQEDNS